MDLSLCMIVKNEAANLPRCLGSVKDVIDQIVVLDTGSTDRTPEIAQSFGAEVHHLPWNNDFAAARNESLKFAQGDWILVLDADEVLAADVMPLLRRAMQQENALVINLVRQEVGATQSPYSLVSRLFRNHPQIQFSRPYHAMVDDSVAQLLQQEPQWQIFNCSETAVLHYGYEPEAIASRDKLQTAKNIMEGFLANHPDDPYGCSKVGALYVQLGELSQGIQLLERGLQSIYTALSTQPLAPGAANAPVLYELHYHLGIAYSRLQKPAQAEQHYRAAMQQPVLDRLKLGAYNNLGNLLKTKGDLANAKAAYQTILDIDPNFAVGYYNLGMTLKAMGNLPEAIAYYQKAIELDPNYAEAHQNLGVTLWKLGNVPASLEAFKQAIALHEQQNPQEAARLRQGLQGMGFFKHEG
jgi:tetratricopeptide (TPR) repeat protein